jgi:hypothetical protein
MHPHLLIVSGGRSLYPFARDTYCRPGSTRRLIASGEETRLLVMNGNEENEMLPNLVI